MPTTTRFPMASSLACLAMFSCASSLMQGAGLAQEEQPVQRPRVTQSDLKQRFAAMQAEPWYQDGGWSADWDDVQRKARDSGRVVLAYFTRSYAP